MRRVFFSLSILALLGLAGNPLGAQMRTPARPGPMIQNMQRPILQGPNPSLHSLSHCLYDWKIRDTCGDEINPCYYDETYGQWVGNCNGSLDTPGYSITVPNQIRR